MNKRMLINAVHKEEYRVAVVEDNELLELEIERGDSDQLRGNIYKAAITRIEPSLQAAFLDIGAERNGFLQINDINVSYFRNWPPNGDSATRNRPIIQNVLQANQGLVVQVVKDGRDTKGATLTTNLSLPGRYLVLMIGNQRGGVSRKIIDEGQRSRLRLAVEKLKIPAGMGVIVRTAGINKTYDELQRDLDRLLDLWFKIIQTSFDSENPKILYKESGLAIRTIRDFLTPDITEILIDDLKIYEDVYNFVERTMPEWRSKVIFYDKPQPLFSSFDLDRQINTINQPEVTLPSGGSIVINITEAIVAIDVNSGRSTSQSDVEETAFNTNIEASREIARQLRLRDLGGLVVIDFIDMWDRRHRQVVEKALRESLRTDKAKIEIGRISKFGLLEMSRQRLKASLVSQSHITCPHCDGRGRVRTAEAAALEVLRKIQSAVLAGGVNIVRIRMAPAAALFLLNHKRNSLTNLEQQTDTSVLVYADGRMKPEQYELELDRTDSDIRNKPETRNPDTRNRKPPRRGSSSTRDQFNENRRSKESSSATPRARNRNRNRTTDQENKRETDGNSQRARSGRSRQRGRNPRQNSEKPDSTNKQDFSRPNPCAEPATQTTTIAKTTIAKTESSSESQT